MNIKTDLVIIGAGCNGLGCALQAATCGMRVTVLDMGDWASDTSSKSTKLIHGGLRYLRSFDFRLVKESLAEKNYLFRTQPHLVQPLQFKVCRPEPIHKRVITHVGVALYRVLDRFDRTVGSLPVTHFAEWAKKDIRDTPLSYWDGRFDDVQMSLALVRTLKSMGVQLYSYTKVFQAEKASSVGWRIHAINRMTSSEITIDSDFVINATGKNTVATEQVFDTSTSKKLVLSRGTHIVLDIPTSNDNPAFVVPFSEDDRVVFAIPWHGNLLVGTTDERDDCGAPEPAPSMGEIDFLLGACAEILASQPSKAAIIATFAGHRTLVSRSRNQSTASIPRSVYISSPSNDFISVAGGKWTTFRLTGKKVLDYADSKWKLGVGSVPPYSKRFASQPARNMDVSEDAIRRYVLEESAQCVSDIICRRLSGVFVNAAATSYLIPEIVYRTSKLLGWDDERSKHELENGYKVCQNFTIQRKQET